MLQRNRSFKRVFDIHFLLLRTTDPLSKLFVVGYGGRKHDNGDSVREFNDNFFPNMSALRVIYIMDFVKDDPLDILHVVAVIIQHGLEHFRSHDHATSVSV